MVRRHDGNARNTVGTTFTASTVHRFLPIEYANSVGKGEEMINHGRRERGPSPV